jgi:galactokinase
VRALRDVTASLLKEAASLLEPVDLARARHVVHENQRPGALVQALSASDYRAAGDVMNQSHASLRDLYEVSSLHLDIICEAARATPACYGARMTGAGFGGCAIALVRAADTSEFISQVQPQYESRTYKRSDFFVVAPDEGARLESRARQNK